MAAPAGLTEHGLPLGPGRELGDAIEVLDGLSRFVPAHARHRLSRRRLHRHHRLHRRRRAPPTPLWSVGRGGARSTLLTGTFAFFILNIIVDQLIG